MLLPSIVYTLYIKSQPIYRFTNACTRPQNCDKGPYVIEETAIQVFFDLAQYQHDRLSVTEKCFLNLNCIQILKPSRRVIILKLLTNEWNYNVFLYEDCTLGVSDLLTVPLTIYVYSPAGTWRKYNVASTSMQRHDVASTLRRRYIYVMCPLGVYKIVMTTSEQK